MDAGGISKYRCPNKLFNTQVQSLGSGEIWAEDKAFISLEVANEDKEAVRSPREGGRRRGP